jgi:hypothetical protein
VDVHEPHTAGEAGDTVSNLILKRLPLLLLLPARQQSGYIPIHNRSHFVICLLRSFVMPVGLGHSVTPPQHRYLNQV